MILLEGPPARTVDARVSRNSIQVFVGEQALGQRAEGDAANAVVFQRVQQFFLNPAVHQAVRGLVNQAGRAHLAQQCGSLTGFGCRVAGDAHVECLALLHGGGQCAHGFFQRGIGVEPVAIEDVHILKAHALETLVQAGQHVFA